MESLLHSTDINGDTILHCAAKAGHAALVQLVIDEYEFNPRAHNKVSVYIVGYAVIQCVVLCFWLSCYSKSVAVSRLDHIACFQIFHSNNLDLTFLLCGLFHHSRKKGDSPVYWASTAMLDCHWAGRPFQRIPLLISSTGPTVSRSHQGNHLYVIGWQPLKHWWC